jgi:hypothetical protein
VSAEFDRLKAIVDQPGNRRDKILAWMGAVDRALIERGEMQADPIELLRARIRGLCALDAAIDIAIRRAASA